jgi:hypothetical protein
MSVDLSVGVFGPRHHYKVPHAARLRMKEGLPDETP